MHAPSPSSGSATGSSSCWRNWPLSAAFALIVKAMTTGTAMSTAPQMKGAPAGTMTAVMMS